MRKNSYNFEQWCLDNGHQDWLDLWDYQLNNKKPNELSYGSGERVYFKCTNPLHKSYNVRICSITNTNKLICHACNSFAQWCVDNKHLDWLELWDNEKNDKTPWEVGKNSTNKYYFKCPRGIHDSELKRIQDFVTKKVKLFCVSCKSIGQYIVDKYGEDYLNFVWSDKNKLSPFKIMAMGEKLCWFRCNNDLHPDYSMMAKSYVNGQNCGICAGRKVLKGFNDIATTHPHLIKYFKEKEDAQKYSHGSREFVNIKCPDCGYEKKILVSKLTTRGFSCPRCGDGHSYPNKFMYSFLSQLNINYIAEYSPAWANNKRYDIFCPEYNLIIENHGLQHYKHTSFPRTLEEEQANDRLKKILAINNGIAEYVAIDCRKSELTHIKNSIMQSILPSILNFNEESINWIECSEMANSSMVKQAYDMWENGMSKKDIANELNVHYTTVERYLRRGNDSKSCHYVD